MPLTDAGRNAQLDGLAAAAGLQLLERWEDATGTPFTDGSSSRHLSVYRRSGSAGPVGA